jgi:hypothetical protein
MTEESNILTALLKRYGIFAIIVEIILVAALGIIAYSLAAPNTEVSILWGLVRYTKAGTSISSRPSNTGPDVVLTYLDGNPSGKTLVVDSEAVSLRLFNQGDSPANYIKVKLFGGVVGQTEPWIAQSGNWIFKPDLADKEFPVVAEYPQVFDLVAKEGTRLTLATQLQSWAQNTKIDVMMRVDYSQQSNPAIYKFTLLVRGTRKQ